MHVLVVARLPEEETIELLNDGRGSRGKKMNGEGLSDQLNQDQVAYRGGISLSSSKPGLSPLNNKELMLPNEISQINKERLLSSFLETHRQRSESCVWSAHLEK